MKKHEKDKKNYVMIRDTHCEIRHRAPLTRQDLRYLFRLMYPISESKTATSRILTPRLIELSLLPKCLLEVIIGDTCGID